VLKPFESICQAWHFSDNSQQIQDSVLSHGHKGMLVLKLIEALVALVMEIYSQKTRKLYSQTLD
jgi:hypothetical protein